MEDSITHLEEKVLKAVRLIKDLRVENANLQQQKQTVESQIEALKEDHQRMSRELEESRQTAARLERFEEKRRIIEEKVGGLLEKLEEIG
jgi:chaperonin cofactor prefoldin